MGHLLSWGGRVLGPAPSWRVAPGLLHVLFRLAGDPTVEQSAAPHSVRHSWGSRMIRGFLMKTDRPILGNLGLHSDPRGLRTPDLPISFGSERDPWTRSPGSEKAPLCQGKEGGRERL